MSGGRELDIFSVCMAPTADELGYLLFLVYFPLTCSISEIKFAGEKKKAFHQDRLGGDKMLKGPWGGEHWVTCVPAGNASLRLKEHELMVTGSTKTLSQNLPDPHS